MLPYFYYRLSYKGNASRILRAVRHTCELSQSELAQYLCMSRSEIGRLERDEKEMDAIFWFQFCQKFNLTMECYRSGYSRRAHLAALEQLIEEKKYQLPIKPKLLRKAAWARARHDQMGEVLHGKLCVISQKITPGLRVQLSFIQRKFIVSRKILAP